MSLLGRLEDLSLTDIVQIVFLSRRTGVLEIIDDRGRHTVLFRHGLVVNASSPEHADLATYLERQNLVSNESARTLRAMESSGIPFGTAALEMNLLTNEDLAAAIRARIVEVIDPLLNSREGEFNFILSESVTALDIEYEPDLLFKEGGISPQRLLGGDGEKMKPLRGLEESLKAGKALLRGSAPAEPLKAPVLDLAPPPAPAQADEANPFPESSGEDFSDVAAGVDLAADEQPAPPAANVLAFPPREEAEVLEFAPPQPDEESAPQQPPAPARERREGSSHFKVAGGLFEIERPEAQYRNVVLYERNPLIRVAARRAFTKREVKIAQFGSLDDVRGAMTDLFRSNSFFVTFLELTPDDSTLRLLLQVKRKNPRLPVVVIDNEADLRRRHDLLRAGADLYLTKPSQARLQPGLAEEELALFSDELVLFAERAFEQWEQMTGAFGAEAGKRFYEIAGKESIDRSFSVLKQLINELSNPNDIEQVSSTILRLAAEYLDRGALFSVSEDGFVGVAGFGVTGAADEMSDRVRRYAVARDVPSLLNDVAASGESHQGKMRKTAANVALIERMGGLLPTEVVALPIVHGGRTIGILYGDNAEHRAPIDSVTGLEIFLTQAGYAFGNAVFAAERAGRT